MTPSSLPWPTGAAPLPVAAVRPVLDRLASLATVHAQDVTLLPGLAAVEEDLPADPPPALEQITDELGGLRVRGHEVLDLQVATRTDVGPYTLLGEPTTWYPLHESPEAAVVLALDEDGTPGAVHGIGEDLALRLAAPDLPAYLERVTGAVEAVLAALSARGPAEDDDAAARDDAVEELLRTHLFDALFEADGTEVPLVPAKGSGIADLPAGALAVADLRGAPLGARVDALEVDLPGDPLDLRLAFREGGRLIVLHQG